MKLRNSFWKPLDNFRSQNIKIPFFNFAFNNVLSKDLLSSLAEVNSLFYSPGLDVSLPLLGSSLIMYWRILCIFPYFCRLDKLTHDPVDEQTVFEVTLFKVNEQNLASIIRTELYMALPPSDQC